MSHLKLLSIKNFMSHKDTEVELSPGVNVFIGPSDNGKSAIIQAINWLLNNQPRGDSYKSHWGGNTIVSGEFSDMKLKRERNNTRNTIQLNDDDTQLAGTSVPDDIASVISMNDLNFMFQMDAPFMLSWKPGERGRFINEICRLDMIDQSISKANSTLRDEKRRLRSSIENKDALEKELESFDGIDEVGDLIVGVENLEIEISETKDKIQKLNTIVDDIERFQDDIDECKEIINFKKQCDDLIKLKSDIESSTKSIKAVENILNSIDYEQKKQKITTKKIRQLREQFESIMPDICPLCGNKTK